MLLYESEIWGVTDAMMTVLEMVHHRIAKCITGMTARKGDGGEWKWASVHAVLETMGLWQIMDHLRSRQAKITEYVSGILT